MNRPFSQSQTHGDSSPLVALAEAHLDMVMPMSLLVGASGEILHLGPTLAKLESLAEAEGQNFFDCFEMLRPRSVSRFSDVVAYAGGTMKLRTRAQPQAVMRGLGVITADNGLLVNLSFGLGAVTAVRDYALTAGDFAATDLTVEMLYLVEANRAVQTELRRYNRRLHWEINEAEEQAFTDTLTGLKNRRALEATLLGIGKEQRPYAFMQIDLDFFKAINDSHGHAAGDAALGHVATVLLRETRQSDEVFRLGGDEFLVLIRGLESKEDFATVAERLRRGIIEAVPFEETELHVDASIGIARSVDYRPLNPEIMLRDADKALYLAKDAGRGRHAFASPNSV